MYSFSPPLANVNEDVTVGLENPSNENCNSASACADHLRWSNGLFFNPDADPSRTFTIGNMRFCLEWRNNGGSGKYSDDPCNQAESFLCEVTCNDDLIAAEYLALGSK